MSRKTIFMKANKEHRRLSGFDLMYQEDYISGAISLSKLLSRNNQWLLDHANDVERGMTFHMKAELDREDENMEEHVRRVSSDMMPTPEHKP